MREIKLTDITREELWAKQRLSFTDIDYAVWERNKSMLHQFSKMNRNCTFVVDVYKCRYAYASPNFVDLLGYDAHKIATLERQGDYLESRHPPTTANNCHLTNKIKSVYIQFASGTTK